MYDLPIQGAVNFGEATIQLLAHVFVPCRMPKKDLVRHKVEVIMITKTLPPYLSNLLLSTTLAPFIRDNESFFLELFQHRSFAVHLTEEVEERAV